MSKDFFFGTRKIGSTMTVKELREKLSQYSDELPVFAEWETCKAYIEPSSFALEEVRKNNESFPALVIDVNSY